ncbi:MAG: 3-oxoacyl-ACP synthase [Acholeplasmataceae bacterium]|jgi:3-oxoacyl-[acyl-carrier-protein] synthase-3|nr:3-oxoacyl-ACP synthase [Acholeplasmataceae bacterium]
MKTNIGIIGIGTYIPKGRVTAKEISDYTKGRWSEDAVISKLGVIEKPRPTDEEGSMFMGVEAAKEALIDAKLDAKDLDLIIWFGEEWKEYPLATAALFVQGKLGATNAWGYDMQNRCASFLTALKIAKDQMIADDSLNTVMIVGGYRNIDLIDYMDPNMSFIYDVSAGAGACILKKGHNRNIILETHHIADGTLAETCVVEIGGQKNLVNKDNLVEAFKFRMLDPILMKNRLGEVSLPNWYKCIDVSLEKSGFSRNDIGYLGILHMKRSAHEAILDELNLTEKNTTYLEHYGHVGQIDPILSYQLGLKNKKIKPGTVVCLLAAGLGYIWSSTIIKC